MFASPFIMFGLRVFLLLVPYTYIPEYKICRYLLPKNKTIVLLIIKTLKSNPSHINFYLNT